MKVFESSLLYRVGRRVAVRVRTVAAHSLVGRFFIGLAAVLRRVFGASWVLGLSHAPSRRLERSGHPLSVLLIARPYLWLRRSGRTGGRFRFPSRFGDGNWVFPVAAGVFALGCGRLAVVSPGLRLAAPALLVVIGGLAFVAGPRLLAAAGTSVVVRGGRWVGESLVEGEAAERRAGTPSMRTVRQPFVWRRLTGPLGAGAVLAAAAGLAAGLTPGPGALALAGGVAALCVIALIFWRPEVMLLAVAAFPWLDWTARRILGGLGPGWDDAFLILALAVLLWCVLVLRRSHLWTVPIMLPLLLAFAAAVGSVVLRDVPGDVAVFALRVLFQPLLFYFLGFLFPKNKRWVQWVVAVFLLSGVALALHGIYQYATNAPMPASWVDIREVDIGTRAYSIIENPNGLGAFLLMGTLLSLSMALSRGLRASRRIVLAAVCAVHLAGVAVTFSRGAWLGLAAGALALIIMAYRRYLAPLVAVGVAGWFAAPGQFTSRLSFAFSSAYITKSLAAGRLYVWKMALQHITAHPLFGVGLGTFGGTSAVRFAYGRYWVDNFYLQLGAEGGLILLAFFLWILLRAAKGLVGSYGMTADPFWRALTAGVFGSFVAVAVANFTASVWETLVVGVGFWFLAGLATSAVVQRAEADAVDGAGSSRDRAGG